MKDGIGKSQCACVHHTATISAGAVTSLKADVAGTTLEGRVLPKPLAKKAAVLTASMQRTTHGGLGTSEKGLTSRKTFWRQCWEPIFGKGGSLCIYSQSVFFFHLQMSFPAYSPFRCFLDTLSHCKKRSSIQL